MPSNVLTRAWLVYLILSSETGLAADSCRIEIVDGESGWPVPLVELRTVSGSGGTP